ncbi:hypothetical protein WAI453_007453 [Rhynchosporium graminicola]|uniref:Calmodulin n=1 Tax=Rhynchosporium graminicola TaxID=2792576 RepID=A0A1E1LKL3_9HELO|nr:related to Calmodulin [Rhynchosporium commune]
MSERYLSEEEISILKHEFDQYDTDKGGNITVEEFGRVMKASGQNPTAEELAQIIKEVDLDGDGTINFDEFIAMMTGRSRAPPIEVTSPAKEAATEEDVDSEADLKSAWAQFDPSLKGSITAAQFRQLLAGFGENVTDAEVDELMNSVDGEDKISYREFVEFAKRRQVNGTV